jgi:UDP-2,3-diacylglucosamine hydrolase
MILYFPPSWALRIREYLQSNSHASYLIKNQRWNYREIIRVFARSCQEQGCDGMVTGHFHLAFCEKLDAPSFTILSLGDWMGQFTYGEMVAGKLCLKSYPMQ